MPNVLSALVRSMVCQVIAFAALLAILNRPPGAFSPEPIWWSRTLFFTSLLGAGTAAAMTGALLRLTRPWLWGNALLPVAAVLSLMFNLPTWAFILLALVPVALYLPALFAQVPYFPSSPATIEKLLEVLPEDRPFTFIDLGCGLGEPLLSLAKQRPSGRFYGIDLSPLSIAIAWIRSFSGRNVQFRLANLWSQPLDRYDFVYAFLAPPPMERLGIKAAQELRTNAQLISNTFPVPGWSGKAIATGDALQHTLFVYQGTANQPLPLTSAAPEITI